MLRNMKPMTIGDFFNPGLDQLLGDQSVYEMLSDKDKRALEAGLRRTSPRDGMLLHRK